MKINSSGKKIVFFSPLFIRRWVFFDDDYNLAHGDLLHENPLAWLPIRAGTSSYLVCNSLKINFSFISFSYPLVKVTSPRLRRYLSIRSNCSFASFWSRKSRASRVFVGEQCWLFVDRSFSFPFVEVSCSRQNTSRSLDRTLPQEFVRSALVLRWF